MEPLSFFMLAFAIVPVVLDTMGLVASFRGEANFGPAVAARVVWLKVSGSGAGLRRRPEHGYERQALLATS
jgi:hypothetical protein